VPVGVRFGAYELDVAGMELRKNGVRIRLQEQPFLVLSTLVAKPGEVVTREELRDRVWASDTFVDFDQSLNKAVNRLREVLNDHASQPRYIETVPRRGYRFVAHVQDVSPAPETLPPVIDGGSALPSIPTPPVGGTRGRKWLVTALSAAIVLLAGAWGWFRWHSRPPGTMVRPLTRLTYNGVSVSPSISRDGKLLAYQATIGGSNPDIWVQQMAGGKAIQITHDKEGATDPVFSPDGTHIAYESNGSIYEIPALGGDARLITNDGLLPAYASAGSAIVFVRTHDLASTDARLFTVARLGGSPVAIQPDLFLALNNPPFALSPDGSRLLALAYRKGRSEQDLKRWWVIPISGGTAEEVASPPPTVAGWDAPPPYSWTAPDKNSRQWVIFGRNTSDTFNLFRTAITSDGKTTSDPVQLTFTTNSFGASVSENGRMVFVNGDLSTNLWSIPVDTNRARVTGERQSLTQVEGVRNMAPSLSRNGQKVAFVSGGRFLVVKDLVTGREAELAHLSGFTYPCISPDGSFVIYSLSTVPGIEANIYSISTAGGSPHQLCQQCGVPMALSSDGSRVLIQKGAGAGLLDKIAMVELATGKVTDLLSEPQHNLYHPHYLG
jgi:DNA-binding winged helix-turn-helix (wHTH) protein/Tol biopolymer transport system component